VTVPTGVAPVSYEILGPLRAWREHDELDLGPGKQRAVLAVLLLNANRPTPTTRIIDAVWGDCPPENGVNVVQKYVAGLRRIIEPGRSPRSPGQLLTWTEAGYTLHVPPGCLDADVFHDDVARARVAGSPADAAAQLRTALGLWHETALAGLPGPYFESARERLADDRAAAFEEVARIELDLGRHDLLVPELGRLVAEYPLREQLRYLLILALYRSGRQAEALAAYQEARRFLDEEFGVEPGDRLQRLHLAILRSDPALSPETPVPVPVPTPVSAPPPEPVATTRRPARWWTWTPWALAIALPLVSLGMLAWVVMAVLAALRRSVALALFAVGYFLLFLVFVMASSDDINSTGENVSGVALVLAMVGGAVHTALLAGRAHRRRWRRPPDPDTLRSLEQRVRREQAMTLLRHHPHIARELLIGRPDLSRVFDDGGLVDVNAVPEHVLAALPGVTVPQAQQIVARRRTFGGFASVEDLATYGLLPLPTVRALSEVLIVVDGEPQDAMPISTGNYFSE
jgi:SARP family transcriptional regulator, regulator of embCAB operon